MMPLVHQISPGTGTAPLILGPEGQQVDRDALVASGVSDRLAGDDLRVAVCLEDPVRLIRALAALDGQVASLLLLSGRLEPETALRLVEAGDCSVLVTDRAELLSHPGALSLEAALGDVRRDPALPTRWMMTTSGTTGLPKIVPHDLRSLSRSVYRFGAAAAPVWGLLYDPTRFAGLQVVLQALIGGGRLVAVDTHLPLQDQVAELVRAGCTHLSATPTLWRRLLMVPGHRALQLRQVTLGGEIVDQQVLSALAAAFPGVRITHIYASTEAGVGFSVTDGRAGFPAGYLGAAPGGVGLKIVDDILWLRPPVSALGAGAPGIEVDADGFVRSGDRVRPAGDRFEFLGRDNGTINIGGVKVHPEAVEAVVGAVPGVALVQISARRNPVTGALVLAEVQLVAGADPAEVRRRIVADCRARLEREAVPAIIRFVDDFRTNAAGKLVRTGAQDT